MPEVAAIAMLLCALVIGVAVETLLGAVFLRAAVAIYNKLAGGVSSPRSIPEPTLGKAMWITFATFLAQLVVGALIVGPRSGDGVTAAGARAQGVDVVAQLIFFPASLLIMAVMVSAKLPTTFGRALLVTLCYLLVVLLVAGVVVGMAILVFAVSSLPI